MIWTLLKSFLFTAGLEKIANIFPIPISSYCTLLFGYFILLKMKSRIFATKFSNARSSVYGKLWNRSVFWNTMFQFMSMASFNKTLVNSDGMSKLHRKEVVLRCISFSLSFMRKNCGERRCERRVPKAVLEILQSCKLQYSGCYTKCYTLF